jgi:hypothetical protein
MTQPQLRTFQVVLVFVLTVLFPIVLLLFFAAMIFFSWEEWRRNRKLKGA